MKLLTKKQEGFAVDYALHGNAARAYRDNYDTSKCTEKSIFELSSRLLKRPAVAARIAELQAKKREVANENFKVDALYVLKRHKEIDDLDIIDIMTECCTALRPLSEWPKAWRTTLAGIDVSDVFEYQDGEKINVGFLKKIRWPDKIRNLELLGKHVEVQAYKDRVDVAATTEHNIMVIPSCTSVDDWEAEAKKNQATA